MVRHAAIRHHDVSAELLPFLALPPLAVQVLQAAVGRHHRRAGHRLLDPYGQRYGSGHNLHALPLVAGAQGQVQETARLHDARKASLHDGGNHNPRGHRPVVHLHSALYAGHSVGTAGTARADARGGCDKQAHREIYRAPLLPRGTADTRLDAPTQGHRRHGKFRQDLHKELPLPHTLREVQRADDPRQLQHHAGRRAHGARAAQALPRHLHRRDGCQAAGRHTRDMRSGAPDDRYRHGRRGDAPRNVPYRRKYPSYEVRTAGCAARGGSRRS